jgi:hypothetical protein
VAGPGLFGASSHRSSGLFRASSHQCCSTSEPSWQRGFSIDVRQSSLGRRNVPISPPAIDLTRAFRASLPKAPLGTAAWDGATAAPRPMTLTRLTLRSTR